MSASVIVGASSDSALALIKCLRDTGQEVVAIVRSPSKSHELASMGCDVRIADATDLKALRTCSAGIPSGAQFVSYLGGRMPDGSRVPLDAYRNVTDLAKHAKASRFTLVSTVGCGTSAVAVLWFFRRLLTEALAVREQAEEYLRASGLAWTVIRPGALPVRAPPSGRGVLCQDPHVMGAIHRSDLADVILRAQQSSQTLEKDFTAVDCTRIWKPYGGQVEPFAF